MTIRCLTSAVSVPPLLRRPKAEQSYYWQYCCTLYAPTAVPVGFDRTWVSLKPVVVVCLFYSSYLFIYCFLWSVSDNGTWQHMLRGSSHQLVHAPTTEGQQDGSADLRWAFWPFVNDSGSVVGRPVA